MKLKLKIKLNNCFVLHKNQEIKFYIRKIPWLLYNLSYRVRTTENWIHVFYLKFIEKWSFLRLWSIIAIYIDAIHFKMYRSIRSRSDKTLGRNITFTIWFKLLYLVLIWKSVKKEKEGNEEGILITNIFRNMAYVTKVFNVSKIIQKKVVSIRIIVNT